MDERLLGHDADLFTQTSKRMVLDIPAIDHDSSRIGFQQLRQHAQQRGLAGTVGSDHGDPFTMRQFQRDVDQGRVVRVRIAEAETLEENVPGMSWKSGPIRPGFLDRLLQRVTESSRRGTGSTHFIDDSGQGSEGRAGDGQRSKRKQESIEGQISTDDALGGDERQARKYQNRKNLDDGTAHRSGGTHAEFIADDFIVAGVETSTASIFGRIGLDGPQPLERFGRLLEQFLLRGQ